MRIRHDEQRVDKLSNDQDTREKWIVAMISKHHVQLWFLRKTQRNCKCSPMYSFSWSPMSPGFQMWCRWLASSSQVQISMCGSCASDLHREGAVFNLV